MVPDRRADSPRAGWALAVLLLCAGGATAAPTGEPGSVQLLAARIRGLAVDGQVRSLLDARLQAVEASPDRPQPWADLGAALQAHGLWDLAAQCYAVATAGDPTEPEWAYGSGLVEYARGETAAALALFARVARLAPEYAPARGRLGDLRLEAGDLEGARAVFAELASRWPEDPRGVYGLARVALQAGDFQTAERLAREALRAHPKDRFGAGLLGAALRGLGERERAAPLLAAGLGQTEEVSDPWADEIAALQTGPAHWLSVAGRYYRLGRGEEVLPQLRRALEDDPGNPRLMAKIGEGYLVTGRLDEAQAILEEARSLAPEHFSVHLHLAQLHRLRGDLRAALASVDTALAINDSAWQAHVERGRLLWALGDRVEATEALDRALARGGHQDLETRMERAEIHMMAGDFATARPVFEDIVRFYPLLPRALAGLAACQAEMGDLAAARATLAGAPGTGDPRLRLVALRIRQLEALGVAGETPP